MQRTKIGKDYYRFIGSKIHDAVIYLIDGYAFARDGATYKLTKQTDVPEGYVRVNFNSGAWYQCTIGEHKEYQAPKPEAFRVAEPLTCNLYFFEKKARELMDLHGLQKWKFIWHQSRKNAGTCYYSTKEIALSQPIAEKRDIFMTIDTILHEIAHALTPGHCHDNVWKAKAIEIGCNGNRCFHDFTPENRWMGTCPNGHSLSRRVRPNIDIEYSCPKCSKKFDRRYLITWTKNVNNF